MTPEQRLRRQEEKERKDALVFKDIAEGKLTYQEILYKHKLKSTSKINRIKKKFEQKLIPPEERRKTVIREKRRAQAISNQMIKKADEYTRKQIDQLENLVYGIEELRQINEGIKADYDGLPEMVKQLIAELKSTKQLNELDKISLIERAWKVLGKLDYVPTREKIRIDAILGLKHYNETVSKLREDLKQGREIQQFVRDFFQATNILPENYYRAWKNKLLELQPSTSVLFNEWERTAETQQLPDYPKTEPTQTEEAEIISEGSDE